MSAFVVWQPGGLLYYTACRVLSTGWSLQASFWMRSLITSDLSIQWWHTSSQKRKLITDQDRTEDWYRLFVEAATKRDPPPILGSIGRERSIAHRQLQQKDKPSSLLYLTPIIGYRNELHDTKLSVNTSSKLYTSMSAVMYKDDYLLDVSSIIVIKQMNGIFINAVKHQHYRLIKYWGPFDGDVAIELEKMTEKRPFK